MKLKIYTTMIKTNIAILKYLDQKKNSFEIIFEEQMKLRNSSKDVVSFINWNRIIVDNMKVINTLKNIRENPRQHATSATW